MKKLRKGLAVLLAVMMPLSMLACAKGNSPEELIEKAMLANEKLENCHADMDIVMDMTVEGQKQATKMTASMDMFSNPMKSKMSMSAEGQNIEMYMDSSYVYMGMMGQWIKSPIQTAQMQQMDVKASMDLYLKNMDNFKLEEEEQVSGLDTYKISGVITGDSLEEVIESSGMMSELEQQLGYNADMAAMIDKMVENIGDILVTIWIEKNDFTVIQYDVDMTNAMSIMMKSMEDALKDEIEEGKTIEDYVKVDQYTMRITMSQINAIEDFEIPAEALAGMEANANALQ